jgi:hypothetical protein
MNNETAKDEARVKFPSKSFMRSGRRKSLETPEYPTFIRRGAKGVYLT